MSLLLACILLFVSMSSNIAWKIGGGARENSTHQTKDFQKRSMVFQKNGGYASSLEALVSCQALVSHILKNGCFKDTFKK